MKRNDKFFLRKMGDTNYLETSNEQGRTMVFMNGTSTFLWEKLEKCPTVEELVEALMMEYAVQEETAEQDVKKFVAFFEEKGCLLQEEQR